MTTRATGATFFDLALPDHCNVVKRASSPIPPDSLDPQLGFTELYLLDLPSSTITVTEYELGRRNVSECRGNQYHAVGRPPRVAEPLLQGAVPLLLKWPLEPT